MSNGTVSRVQQIQLEWADVVERWLDRCDRATDEAADSRYSTDKWLSDMLTTWRDAANFWYFPYKLYEDLKRTVTIAVDPAMKDGGAEAMMVPDPGTDSLGWGALTRTGAADTIPQANVNAVLVQNRRTLVVQVTGLTVRRNAGLLPAGEYTGDVTPTGTTKALAAIKVVVA